jgi:hypothetical protein
MAIYHAIVIVIDKQKFKKKKEVFYEIESKVLKVETLLSLKKFELG